MPVIRPYRADDLDALYAICLATGDAGADAAELLLGSALARFIEPRVLSLAAGAGFVVIGAWTLAKAW